MLLLTALLCAVGAEAALYGFAIEKVEANSQVVAIATIDTASGNASYSKSHKDFPSDAFCNVAFVNGSSPKYYAPAYTFKRGYQSILGFDALTGDITSNVTMDLPYALPATTFDSQSRSIIGIAFDAAGNKDIISIDPTTGKTNVLQQRVAVDDFQLCEAAYEPPTRAYPLGVVYYLWEPLNESATEVLVALDVAQNRTINAVNFHGGLNGISLWYPSGQAAILAFSYLNTRPPQLVSIEPVSGNMSVLIQLPASLGQFATYQGDMAYSAAENKAWVIVGLNDPGTGPCNSGGTATYCALLATFDLAVSPVTVDFKYMGDGTTGPEIWSIDWN